MAAGNELTPSEYIQHHLTFFTRPVGDAGGFWSINVDTLAVSILLGLLGIGFIWWVVRGATAGVPSKRQAFVEILIDFVDSQAKGIFHHGDRNRFVAPLALTVFIWVVLMNAMDFLPADLVGLVTHNISDHGFRYVPTADVNTTFALSISVLLLTLFFAISVKGLGGWLHELFCAPFGAHPLLWPFNFAMQIIEFVAKTVSDGMRLFGNMYAGELIFLLIALMGGAWSLSATGIFLAIGHIIAGWAWAVFHILIITLQAFVFMMLALVYIGQAHDAH